MFWSAWQTYVAIVLALQLKRTSDFSRCVWTCVSSHRGQAGGQDHSVVVVIRVPFAPFSTGKGSSLIAPDQ
jgi:hypothetical protein